MLPVLGGFVTLVLPSTSLGQQKQTYTHPSLDIAFEATANWRQVPRPEDKLIYEVADPDGAVHVVLWATSTEQSASGYLWKMADMRGMTVPERPTPTTIGGSDAWILSAPGSERNVRSRVVLAVIPHGKSMEWPREDVLYIVMIWCPEEDYERHQQVMGEILGSVQLVE